MNKKINTLLFVTGATLFNIIITVLLFLLMMIVYVRLIMGFLPEGTQAWSFPIIFIAAIVISFFIYRFAIKLLMKKIDADKYFDPIFSGKRRGSGH